MHTTLSEWFSSLDLHLETLMKGPMLHILKYFVNSLQLKQRPLKRVMVSQKQCQRFFLTGQNIEYSHQLSKRF